MKKLLALVLVACMILAVGAFSAFADEGDLVGLSMPTKSLERWNRDGTYLKEQFEAAGYKVELTYSDNDAVKQNNDIANMIADGVKVLVVVAIDADSLSATLADAKEAGITVIAYDRLINNADIAYYVSFDNYTVGVLQAKALKAIEDPEEKKKFIAEKEAEYTEKFASPYQAANRGYIDDVIEPRYTRARVVRAFENLQTKRLTNPLKKHSNIPL